VTMTAASTAAADLNTIDGKTGVAVNAAAITALTGDASAVATALASSGITGFSNPEVTLTGTTAAAEDLNTSDGLISGAIDASTITTLTGAASAVSTALESLGITGLSNPAVTLSDATVTAAQILTLEGQTTGTVSVNSISDSLVNVANLNIIGSGASIINNASGTVTAIGTNNSDAADFSSVAHAMIIVGNDGNDNLAGTNYADTITGGSGADSLIGKGGADVFYFAPGDSPTVLVGQLTYDKIGDFAPSADKIDLSVNPVLGASESRTVTLSGLLGGVSIDATGKVTFTGDGAGDATISELLAAVRTVVTGVGEVAYFEFNDGFNFVGTSTFLYQENGASVNDTLIMLSGVSNISSISSTAGGTNTLFIA